MPAKKFSVGFCGSTENSYTEEITDELQIFQLKSIEQILCLVLFFANCKNFEKIFEYNIIWTKR